MSRNGWSTGVDLEVNTYRPDIRNSRLRGFPNRKESSFWPINLLIKNIESMSRLQELQLEEVVR